MTEDTQYMNFRCPTKYREEIDKLVGEGFYKDRTEFLIEAIRVKLYPDEEREIRKKRIERLLKEDPEIRRELGLK